MIPRLLLAVAAVPLVIYPGVLMAGLMQLAAEPSRDPKPVLEAVARAFVYSSLLYPFGYGAGCGLASNGRPWAGAAVACGHLAVCLATFAAWYAMSVGR